MKKVGIALGGGGAKGLAHIAFLKVLDEKGIRPSVISGTSMGAIIGAMYASGMSAVQIENTFSSMTLRQYSGLIDISIFRKKGVIKGDKILSKIREIVGCRDFKDLEIPLKIVATDLTKRKQVIMDKGDVCKAVRASISIPGVFEPVIQNNHVIIDGSFSNLVPYDIIRKECDILIAVDILMEDKKKDSGNVPHLVDTLISSFYMLHRAKEEKKSSSLKPEIYIKLSMDNIGFMEFHKTKKALADAEKEAKKFSKKIEKKLG